uniref:Uncharacterized protein n=1 Tax=Anguilla anguilla TaxID=7936 RepID=A0A0E9XSE3_ANGAN
MVFHLESELHIVRHRSDVYFLYGNMGATWTPESSAIDSTGRQAAYIHQIVTIICSYLLSDTQPHQLQRQAKKEKKHDPYDSKCGSG